MLCDDSLPREPQVPWHHQQDRKRSSVSLESMNLSLTEVGLIRDYLTHLASLGIIGHFPFEWGTPSPFLQFQLKPEGKALESNICNLTKNSDADPKVHLGVKHKENWYRT